VASLGRSFGRPKKTALHHHHHTPPSPLAQHSLLRPRFSSSSSPPPRLFFLTTTSPSPSSIDPEAGVQLQKHIAQATPSVRFCDMSRPAKIFSLPSGVSSALQATNAHTRRSPAAVRRCTLPCSTVDRINIRLTRGSLLGLFTHSDASAVPTLLLCDPAFDLTP
jgi:hypothetical protein